MKSKKLIIVGASSNAKLIKYYFSKDSDFEPVAFCVDSKFINSTSFEGLPLVPAEDIQNLYPPSDFSAFIAIGYKNMNKIRQEMYERFKNMGYILPNYISTRCSFLTDEPLGDNNLILEENTIQPFVKIGSNNVFWSGNHIGHDTCIGNHCFVSSHVVVSGFVTVRNNVFLGVNSTIRDSIEIADETLIAASASVMKSTLLKQVILPPRSTVSEKLSNEIEIS